MYHLHVEAALAQPGQHFIEDFLDQRGLLPGFREGMGRVAADEQRHIAFGVKLLSDLRAEDPVGVPVAVADVLRETMPLSAPLFIPPGWDRRYTQCFDFELEDIFAFGARSIDSKLRAAGMPLESLPGPEVYPHDLSPEARADFGLALCKAGILGPRTAPIPRDRPTLELLGDVLRRATVPAAARTPLSIGFAFTDAPQLVVRVSSAGATAAVEPADHADVRLRARLDDFADVVGGRLDRTRALVTGRLRVTGAPRALLALRRVMPG